MSKYVTVTVDQWEEDDDGHAYGIINVEDDGRVVAMEVFEETADVREMIEFLTGMTVSRLTPHPFNPFGDGRTWTAELERVSE